MYVISTVKSTVVVSLQVLCCSYLHANEKCPSVSYVCEISFTLSHCDFIPLWMNAHTHTAWSLQARWAWCHSRSIQVFPWTVPVTTRPGITSTLWWVPSTSVPGMQGGGGGYPFASIAKRNGQSSESGITVCMYIYMYVAVTLMIGEQVSGMWQANIWLATRVLFAMRMVWDFQPSRSMDEHAMPPGPSVLEQLHVKPNSNSWHLYTATPHTVDDGNEARVQASRDVRAAVLEQLHVELNSEHGWHVRSTLPNSTAHQHMARPRLH